MKTLCLMFVSVVVTLSPIKADTVLSPFALGNASTPSPFFVTSNSAPSARYQQVYSGSDFQRRGAVPYLITGISFGAGSGGPSEVTVPDLQISFSTTQKAPDGLSSAFSQNMGLDDTLVFSGPLHVVYTGFEWNMHIAFQQPFLYDSRAGNLLMDVRNFHTIAPIPEIPPGTHWAAGSVFAAGDTTSSALALDVNSLNATSLRTDGLLTLFTVTPVPEPSTVILFALGLSWFGLLALRRRGKGSRG